MIDDLLKGAPHLAPWRPAVGSCPSCPTPNWSPWRCCRPGSASALRPAGRATPMPPRRPVLLAARTARRQRAPARRRRPARAGHRGAGRRHDIWTDDVLTAAIWHNDHTSQPTARSLLADDHRRPHGIDHL